MAEHFTNRQLVLGGLAAGAAVAGAALLYKSSQKTGQKRTYKEVGTLESIYIHPVKSCRAIEITKGQCTKRGLVYGALKDRHWMILNEEDRFQSMSHEPTMVLITPSLSEDSRYLILNAPNMPSLKIPIDLNEIPVGERQVIETRLWQQNVAGKYCGQEAEAWLTKYFGKPMKMIYGDDDITPREVGDGGRTVPIGKKGDLMIYQDDAAFNLMADSSLVDLNSKMDAPLTEKNFRPNFVVSDSQPYDEDNWKYIKVGDVVLRHVKCNERCKVTTVDPDTGKFSNNNDPMKTLKTYRMCKPEDKALYHDAPLFGVHLAIDQQGTVTKGDTVYAVYE
ncbi:mitochondrial amidoxime-reducing component 1-like [Ptychodera flava]|uniref:mitochondrial amidoxime-reducing component 1-like n=1 Tax=Ptychodera flava TaxID=63121 RepID=UPI003969D7D8